MYRKWKIDVFLRINSIYISVLKISLILSLFRFLCNTSQRQCMLSFFDSRLVWFRLNASTPCVSAICCKCFYYFWYKFQYFISMFSWIVKWASCKVLFQVSKQKEKTKTRSFNLRSYFLTNSGLKHSSKIKNVLGKVSILRISGERSLEKSETWSVGIWLNNFKWTTHVYFPFSFNVRHCLVLFIKRLIQVLTRKFILR